MFRHFDRGALLLVSVLCIFAFGSCSSDSTLEGEILELCKYIPDHGLKDGADRYLTEDYYRAYAEAFDAPTGGFIGDEEFLYYFVNGQEGYPIFSFKKIRKSDNGFFAEVYVQPGLDGSPLEGTGKTLHVLKLVPAKESGNLRYLLDDFDSTKQQCLDYVKSVRSAYKSGEFEKELAENGATAEEIDSFRKDLLDFYSRYGD